MFSLVPEAFAAGSAAQPSMWAQIIPLILIVVVFYVFLILPQQKQRKKHQEFINSLKRGDKIITSSGIYGTITKVNEDNFVIEIADGVQIKISKNSVVSKQ
ncbi:preprotein translocase subunit YajC [Hippea maritima]|uniref:Sec translocon accessory complex subunit YajC n=1 Tax=Hippea maritima (strain ATCC 700847 / DSM 10411 / MH2) TaxID=760142 RepID=F2LVF8_HIPMA|nr:preprotein translocase subunit YajC [Hippea maritima]AEA33742.1 preprotein translocase, YajC subunit [Hippea maritima DSM 10411]